MKKCLFSMLLVLTLVFACVPTMASAAEGNINVIINGQAVAFTDDSGYPFIDKNNRTMVPLRVTMETAGATVGYDPQNQTAIVVYDHDRIEVPIGTDYLYNNNQKIQNDTVSVALNGRTYLPIRAVLESAGFTVAWNGENNAVIANNFDYDLDTLVPYHTSELYTLLTNLLEGNVVYIDGSYYATPDYVKMLAKVQTYYLGDDINTAIYPMDDHRFDLANAEVREEQKEWVSLSDLQENNILFQILVLGDFNMKGFYSTGLTSEALYETPSIPDDFMDSPTSGTFDGIHIKVENGEILFLQADLIAKGVVTEPINDSFFVVP